jgi:Kef-type K+ transport system membrane component KefB
MIEGSGSIALIIIFATLLGVFAKKTGQPTVIAYIVTGLILGPVGLNAASETGLTQLLSELGLVFLLFLIGLEIDIEEIKEVLKPTLGIGIIQMALTAGAGFIIAAGIGFTTIESLLIGAAVMFSSTALVVKLLADRDEGSTLPGRLDIGILLIQDVVVILILALISIGSASPQQIAIRLLEVFAMISMIGVLSYLSSKYILPKILKQISDNKSAFFTHGVAWAFIFITAANHFNLSMEIGAFIAGIGFAQLPYSRELQERVRPLTDLFMAVFFINFGLNMIQSQLSAYFFEAIIFSVLIMIAKFGIFFSLIDRFKFTPETSFTASVNMTQISEFGLILGSLAATEGIISGEITGFLSLLAIITMGTSSYLIRYRDRIHGFSEDFLQRFESEDKNDIEIESIENHALVLGYDTVSKNCLESLKEHFGQVVIVDRNPDNIDELANSEHEYIYGDLNHGEIRKAAGLDKANLVLSVIPDIEVNKEIIEHTDQRPTLFLKAGSLDEAGELYEMGAHYVILRNVLTGERMSEYLKLYLEDRELFKEEVGEDINRIRYGGREE